MPRGLISTTGAWQLLGRLTLVAITALPFSESGTVAVVAAAVVSLPQYSDASTDVTGPGVPSSGMINPLMAATKTPLLSSWNALAFSTQGAEPAVTPCSTGSVGTLGASVLVNSGRAGAGMAEVLSNPLVAM